MRLGNSVDGSRRASVGTAIAVAGIAVSFIVMLLSIVVMLGFKSEIRAKIIGFDSQIIVFPQASRLTGITSSTIDYTHALENTIKEVMPGAEPTLTIATPVIFKTSRDFQGMVIKGVDCEKGNRFIESNLIKGQMPSTLPDSVNNEVVVPAIMAKRLRIDVGDKIQAFFISQESVKARNMVVAGIYDTHFSDYDKVYAFARRDFLQNVSQLTQRQGTTVTIDNIGNDAAIDDASERLQEAIIRQAALDPEMSFYQVRNIHETGAAYFSWLSLLDTNVIVILILMAIVSGFTLVSSLFIIILERVNMIGILRALGATSFSIVKIFMYVAQRLVLRGLLIGNVVAGIVIFAQTRWHIIPLDPESYYLNYVPVEVNAWIWIGLNLGVMLLAALVLLAPAKAIASIKPTTAIRYE